MKSPSPDLPRVPLTVSLTVSIILLAVSHAVIPDLTAAETARRLLWPLIRLLGMITVGLVAGQIIEATGWVHQLAVVARPAFRFGRLGDHCGAAFTTAFFSGTAANAMLLEFYRQGHIDRRRLFMANLLAQFPAYFLHLPTTLFVVLSLTGRAGILYFGLTFAALVARCAALLAYGRLFLPAESQTPPITGASPAPNVRKDWTQIRSGVARRLPRRLAMVAVWVVPVYIGVFLLHRLGLFEVAQDLVAETFLTRLVPVESLSMVVLGFMAEFTSGFAAAGALMEAGVLSVKQTALALLIGNVIAFPIRALRHQLPHYMGIFTPRLGAALLLAGQGYRILSLMLAGALYAAAG